MSWKTAARAALHGMGGLAALRMMSSQKFRVLTYHSFSEANQTNVDAICSYIGRHFEVMAFPKMVEALKRREGMPKNALAITVDDGYRNYAVYGHPVFQKHKIPVTVYAVAGFAASELWLWPDQIEFGLLHTTKSALTVDLGSGEALALELASAEEKTTAISTLTEALKVLPNVERLRFMDSFGALCGVDIPANPPEDRAALTWEELRGLAAEGVEIGCHTATHPIMSRLPSKADLARETKGAKDLLEQGLGLPVRHFCYPNGKPPDINDAVVESVKEAGFDSAVTCFWGLNSIEADPFRIQRLPFDSATDFEYGVEVLAGLHLY